MYIANIKFHYSRRILYEILTSTYFWWQTSLLQLLQDNNYQYLLMVENMSFCTCLGGINCQDSKFLTVQKDGTCLRGLNCQEFGVCVLTETKINRLRNVMVHMTRQTVRQNADI